MRFPSLVLPSALLVTGLALSGAACGAPVPCELVEGGDGPRGTVAVRAERVVAGLEVPWGIAFLPGGELLVTERPGRVRLVRGGELVAQPVVDLEVVARGEGGLMGIALDPGFAENRRFYLYYTAEAGGRTVNRLERFRLGPDATSATRERVLLDGIPAARYHDGGRLRVGLNDMLYLGTGDAGEPRRAQDRDDLGGKLLRLTLDGGAAPGNPWPGKRAFITGVRNLEAFDWRDRETLVLVDHGPSGDLGRRGHDEASVARAGDNLGWPTIYGCQSRSGLVTPSLTWQRAVPPGGAAFYTGSAIEAWRGSLLVGTLGSKHLHRVVFDPSDGRRVLTHEVYFPGDSPSGLGRLREVVMGPDGHLYVATSNCDGRGQCPPEKDAIYRIVPEAPAQRGARDRTGR